MEKGISGKNAPFLTGGEMIESVSRDGAVFAQPPHKFEAGTVNAGGAAGLAAAIDYIENIGFEQIQKREDALTALAMEKIREIPFVHIMGQEIQSSIMGLLPLQLTVFILTILQPFWMQIISQCGQDITVHSRF